MVVDCTGDRKSSVLLVAAQGSLGYRAESSVHPRGVIAEALQFGLHVGDGLIRWQAVVFVDRPIVVVGGVIRVVTPGRVPPAIVPTPVPAADENDRVATVMPPIVAVIPIMMAAMMVGRLAPVRMSALPVAELVLRRAGKTMRICRIVTCPIPMPCAVASADWTARLTGR